MTAIRLQGQCACGRNQYAIHVPEQSDELAQVVYSNSSHARRLQAAPLTAFLKIPVTWFESSTVAFKPDETHQTIRKSFQSPRHEHLQNQFCGYCGTQLSQFNSASREYDTYIWITVGTLDDDDLELLEELGGLDLTADTTTTTTTTGDEEATAAAAVAAVEDTSDNALDTRKEKNALFKPAQRAVNRGAPWFESMVEETQLGRVKRQRGGQTSEDGTSSFQWEVVEFTSNDDDNGLPIGKRKADDMET